MNVIAWSEVDQQRRHALPQWIERDGALVAPFEFTGFAPGEVHLMILDSGGVPVRWNPEPGSVQAPIEDLVFEGDDLAPPRRVLLRVVDALDGAPIEGFEAEIAVDGIPQALESVPPAHLAFWIDVQAELHWRVTAPGYAPEEGGANPARERGRRPGPPGAPHEDALSTSA